MNITEMHILFRQLAQQMGLQNVRGILPEQIDLLLNTSILDVLKQIIQTNIGLTSPNGIVTNSKIGQINSLKGLYLTTNNIILTKDFNNVYKFSLPDCYLIDNVEVTYAKMISERGDYTILTNPFNVRLIDKALYTNAINDPILAPKLNSPIGYQTNSNFYVATKLEKDINVILAKVNYIKKPIIVNSSCNIDSDMPEQHHNDIVKHAVELYLSSIGVGQRQERDRNNQQ